MCLRPYSESNCCIPRAGQNIVINWKSLNGYIADQILNKIGALQGFCKNVPLNDVLSYNIYVRNYQNLYVPDNVLNQFDALYDLAKI